MKTIFMALGLSMALTVPAARSWAQAELPPAGFDGRQYVDSRGCVYVRAGFDGSVTWVPQLTANRQPLCGMPPTVEVGTAPPPAVPADAQSPVVVAVPAPPPPAPAARPRPAAAQATAPVRATAPRVAVAPAIVPAPVAPTLPRSTTGSPFYPAPSDGAIHVPEGYRVAWEDDRLNPNRGKQTLSGALQMALVWTQEVPRRLVDTNSGRDVTEELRYLVYPYTDYGRQLADLRAGTHVAARTAQGERLIVKRSEIPAAAPSAGVQPRVSTKSGPVPVAAGAGRYVQVGTFGSAADAERVAGQLRARGLPVRLARYRDGAAGQRLVMAGPFADPAALDRALSVVRGIGFAGATLR